MRIVGLSALFACIGLFAWMVNEKMNDGGFDFFKGGISGAVGNSPDYYGSYSRALQEAKISEKPVLVIFSASWCGPCQKNKKELYPHESVQPYHDKFIWAYLDTDKPENAKIAKQYGIRSIPTLHTITAREQRLDSFNGGGKPANFVAFLERSLKKAGR